MQRIAKALGALGLLLALSPATHAQPSQAQNWPQRSVRFIIPLGPGSGADIGARLFGDRLSARWGQPVVIENRPGGDGVVAITAFTGARDDHVLLFSPVSSFSAHPLLHQKLPYDARDLAPIARVSNTVVSVAVTESLGIGSVKELVARARAEPGKLNWASITGMFDFVFLGFLKNAGIDLAKVPYRDTVQAVNDLSEGRIQTMLSAVAIVRPHVQNKKIRMIAVTNTQRAPTLPDLPTAAEAGFPSLSADGLTGLFGPLDMPSAVRDRIAADIREVAKDPEIVSRLTATGQIVSPGSPAEFAASIEEQRARLAVIAKELGIKPPQ